MPRRKFGTHAVGCCVPVLTLMLSWSIAFADDLFVSCGGDNTIRRVRPNGSTTVFATRKEALKTNPFGLVFDNHGDLYVSDNGNNNGTTVSRIAPGGASTVVASGLSGPPLALTIDAAGNLYVGINVGNQISRIARDGTVQVYATGVNRPFGLAFDRNGNLYAASLHAGRVTRIAPDGTTAVVVSGPRGPFGLAFDRDGRLFMSNVRMNWGHISTIDSAEKPPSGFWRSRFGRGRGQAMEA